MTHRFDGDAWICDVQHSITLFGGGGGGTAPAGNTTTTQTTNPWSGQQPYLTDVFSRAQNLYDNYSPQYFTGSTVAPLDPLQSQAIDLEAQRGLAGSPVQSAAAQTAQDFLNGNYLSAGNPYFQNMAGSVLANVVPGLEAQFNQGNSMNNPGVAYAVSQGATDALGNLAYQNYSDQIGNQLKTLALAPQTAGMDYQNIAAVGDAGAQLQSQAQQQINDAVARFNFQQQLPYEQLNNYANLVQGGYGSTSAITQPYFQNQTANILGGALGGGMLGSMGAGALGLDQGYGMLGGVGLGALLAFL
jgi:hypothetical protein